MGSVKSTMVDGKWPVNDFGVPPLGLAEVSRTAPLFAKRFSKTGWSGMRMPMVA